jgi:hypothetical protein
MPNPIKCCGPVVLAVSLLFFGDGARAAEIEPVNLLEQGDCEQVDEDGHPVGWKVNNSGRLAPTDDARSGDRALRFTYVDHDWGYCAFAGPVGRISPKAVYRASLWAKGKGAVKISIYQSSSAGFIGTDFLPEQLRLTDQWQKFEVVYRPKDPRISKVGMAVQLSGKDSEVVVDDVAFTFNPEENPGISAQPDKPAETTLSLAIECRDAEATLWVDGRSVPIEAGRANLRIVEGLVSLAVEAEAAGPAPGVAVYAVDHKETGHRWRIASEAADGWRNLEFDDAKWAVAKSSDDELIWAEDPKAERIYLRQVLLWNETHLGPNRCIVPPIARWEFPRGGFDILHVALYSPLPYRLDDYSFTVDVPEGFRLLDKQNYKPRYVFNVRPEEVVEESLERQGRPYRRYRLSFRNGDARADGTRYCLLPLVLDEDFEPAECRFYVRRAARGNFTELEQSIPVKILPPVRGRKPEKILISQYSPLGYSTISDEHIRQRIRADAAAGCNTYILSFPYAWGESWRAYVRRFHDVAIDTGARVVVWMNFPLNYGGLNEGHLAWYPDWLRNHPEAHGRYYQGEPAWGATKRKCPYCNEYVISPGGGQFWDIVAKEYRRIHEHLPGATMFFSDWEFHNVNKDGTGVHCFCDRCKKAFREFAGLPADVELSDETIMQRHREAWLAFRDRQDAAIQGHIAETVHNLDCRYMTYTWAANMGFWEACRGKIDVAFVGMPGNSPADSHFQPMLDRYAPAIRKATGLPRVVGQRFVFFCNEDKDGWKSTVLSHDGLVHPKSWKSQVLRVVASLGGGIDLQDSAELCGGIRYYLGDASLPSSSRYCSKALVMTIWPSRSKSTIRICSCCGAATNGWCCCSTNRLRRCRWCLRTRTCRRDRWPRFSILRRNPILPSRSS